MKDAPYTIVALHKRPEFTAKCCKLINSEWPRGEVARLRTLNMSCDKFPTCLILLDGENLVGHCKISLIPTLSCSCFIESVVIDRSCRSQGLGTKLMRGTEEYVRKRGFKKVYLTTKGQEEFYAKNGYDICEPVDLFGYSDFTRVPLRFTRKQTKISKSFGPPPPPMPSYKKTPRSPIVSSKTYMVKQL